MRKRTPRKPSITAMITVVAAAVLMAIEVVMAIVLWLGFALIVPFYIWAIMLINVYRSLREPHD